MDERALKSPGGGEGPFKKSALRGLLNAARTSPSATRLGPERDPPRDRVPDRGETRLLFDQAAHGYERVAQWLSWGQYLRWRDRLVQVVSPECGGDTRVLDVATGTGAIARRLRDETGARVLGVDLTRQMLRAARRQAHDGGDPFAGWLVQGDALRLPLEEQAFDVVTMSYLLRYVEDSQEALVRLVSHVRPGGWFAFIEFHVPPHPFWRSMWRLHTRLVLPVGGRIVSPGWGRVGGFLGPSIEGFWRERDLGDLRGMMEAAGLEQVQVEPQSLGGGLVAWGRRVDAGGTA